MADHMKKERIKEPEITEEAINEMSALSGIDSDFLFLKIFRRESRQNQNTKSLSN